MKLYVTLPILLIGTVAAYMVEGSQASGITAYYQENLPPARFAQWMIGFIIATVSPPAVTLAFWFGAERIRYGWRLHILLSPAMYAILLASINLMLAAAQEPDTDGLTGWATTPAAFLMLICLLAYYIVLIVRAIIRRRYGRRVMSPPATSRRAGPPTPAG